MDFDDSGLHMDEGETSTSASAPGSLSPTSRRARDRESEAIRRKASSPNVVFHAAMRVHDELGNESAKMIHKELMDNPNSMDGYFQPPGSIKKLSLSGAVSLLVNHVSKSF